MTSSETLANPLDTNTKVSFKEWLLICEAMGRGETSLLVRKGGIAEGRDGFSFKHSSFWLFPTFFHEQVDKVRTTSSVPLPHAESERSELVIQQRVELLWTATVTDELLLPQLAPHHLWTENVVKERFSYEESPGIHIAFARVFQLVIPIVLPWERAFGGCRSWVKLPQNLPTTPAVAARPETELLAESHKIRSLLRLPQ